MSNLLKNKKDIIKWLETYNIENYTLIEDNQYGYLVDVDDSIDLSQKSLKKIEVKFNHIKGDFNCSHNELISLIGAPQIVDGYFDCSNNKLKNLGGLPNIVDDFLYCVKNPQLGIYQNMTTLNEIKITLEKENLSKNLIIPEINSIIHKL